MGGGHLMRCVALAQAWQDAGGKAVFLMQSCGSTLEERLASEGIEYVRLECEAAGSDDASLTMDLLDRYAGDCLVLDGYHFDAGYRSRLASVRQPLVYINDLHGNDGCYADIILNPSLDADQAYYADRPERTQLLLGAQYVLLRREFTRWKNRGRSTSSTGRKVLVTAGGGDSINLTSRIISALDDVAIEEFKVKVVIESYSAHRDSIQAYCQSVKFQLRIVEDTRDISELMAWADLAISTGGSTCWELAFTGLPAIVITAADNQIPVVSGLEREGTLQSLGWVGDVSQEEISQAVTILLNDAHRREEMSRKGRLLIDGLGSKRVTDRILSLVATSAFPR